MGTHGSRLIAAIIAAMLLGGCASTAVRENFGSAQQFTRERLGAEVRWLDTDEARRQAQAEVDALLQKPLSADDAVRIALAYSPSLAGDAIRRRGVFGECRAVGAAAESGLYFRAPGSQRRRHARARDQPHAGDLGARLVSAARATARRRLRAAADSAEA